MQECVALSYWAVHRALGGVNLWSPDAAQRPTTKRIPLEIGDRSYMSPI